jgi:hypothetical protein
MFGRLRALTFVLISACALSTSGCYTYHVYQVGGGDGREMGNQPGTEWRSKTLHAFLWGALRQDLPVDNCQLATGQRFGMEEVKIDKNIGHLLASFLTLGLWVPIKVSYRCGKPPVPTGNINN